MRSVKKSLCLLLSLLFAGAGLAMLSGCGGHTHSGALQSLRTDASDIPCCGVYLCESCGGTYEAAVTFESAGLPVVNIEGSLDGISKTDKVTVSVTYDGDVSFTSAATLKWQGGATLEYPKKNYSLQFITADGGKNKVALRESWGSQSKYCLKANWEDFGGTRNLVAAAIWGDIVHSRGIADRLDPLVNGGAVDGFPVLLYHNGVYQGLYTLNMPKDHWIFGMTKKNTPEGLLFGEEWSDSTSLRAPIPDVTDPAAAGWDVEYSAVNDPAPLAGGMNRLIGFLLENDGPALREGLAAYTDVDRAIDYLLYILFILGADNTGRNILWATFDGEKYIPSAYDLDNTWRGNFAGAPQELVDDWTSGDALRSNLLFDRLLDNYPEEIAARYAALRQGPLSAQNVERRFSAHLAQLPDYARAAERDRWPSQPDNADAALDRFMNFFTARCQALDARFGM